MDEAKLTKHIVDTLSKSGDLNDLLLEICETTSMTWSEAEALVGRVQEEQAHVVAGRKFPLLVILALGIFLGGLALVGYGVYVLASEFSFIQSSIQNAQQIQKDLDAFNNLVISAQIIFQTGFGPISMIFVGTAMLLGSLTGMKNSWRTIIDHWMDAANAR